MRGAIAGGLALAEGLTLARVTGWPAERARALLAAPDWRARLGAALREDAEFRTAVLLASRGLRPAVERALRGEPPADREATRLLAYAVRMATRTTPFGLFASVGPVAFGTEERRVEPLAGRAVHANVDHGWLVGAVDALAERDLTEGEDVVLATATALRREGARFTLLDERKVTGEANGTQYRSVTIAATPPIACALELAAGGMASNALAAQVAARFGVDAPRARSLVAKLAAARFLIPAARPAPLDDARERLASFAPAQPSLAPLAEVLNEAARELRGVPGPAVLETTAARLRAAVPAEPSEPAAEPLFVDTAHGELALPPAVRDDVLVLADVLLRCGAREHLDPYRERFMARYESAERLVPLLELVGPHGIGIPATAEIAREPLTPARRARLAALVGAALREGAGEIALSEADWAAIRPDSPEPPRGSLEVGFHVLAPSFDAIAAGEYRIVSSPLVASDGAGKTTGRFAKYRDEAFRARLRATVAAEAPPGAITAEPLFVPQSARTGNVIAHPLVAEAVVPINARAAGADAIPPDDLLVGIDGERIALWSRARNRRVHPVWPHAFNVQLAPPLARFLALAARDGGRLPMPLDAGDFALLPFVPRIRLGRVVLRRATWTFPAAELRARGLAALAAERALPRRVLYGEADNVLVVDTASAAGAALLADQTRALAPGDLVRLAEAAVDDGDLWLRDASGARYPVELVASVRADASPKPARPAPFVVDERARTRTPASPWCYLKLYANGREFRAQVAPELLRFAEESVASGLAARWFYVLYGDPDHHVRLRLRARDGAEAAPLRERALAFAERLAASGAVSRYALATYERELERYGGAEGIARAERLFHIDSTDALRAPGADLLAGRERLGALLPPLLALFDALTNADERERWIAERRPSTKPATRDEAEVLRASAGAAPPDPSDERVALGRELAACCGEANPYLDVVDSLLHMHLNRRGAGGEEETVLRRLLWKALFARSRRIA
ncbi:MAG TPA: lantibiotic dehydratase [Candidatus Elarobacter sp.]|nr:lantibiotic dehydratase [Candidatus Elarobacter sp.]